MLLAPLMIVWVEIQVFNNVTHMRVKYLTLKLNKNFKIRWYKITFNSCKEKLQVNKYNN